LLTADQILEAGETDDPVYWSYETTRRVLSEHGASFLDFINDDGTSEATDDETGAVLYRADELLRWLGY
jgi:hypothetical protein